MNQKKTLHVLVLVVGALLLVNPFTQFNAAPGDNGDAQLAQVTNASSIDLAPYFLSNLVPSSFTAGTIFETVSSLPGREVRLNSKFNQPDNYEIYVVTGDRIYLRYETAPVIFGGVENAVRRMKTTQTNASTNPNNVPQLGVDVSSASNGMVWYKRFVSSTQSGQAAAFAASYALDHITYSSSGSYFDPSKSLTNTMFLWHEFIQSSDSFQFGNTNVPLGKVLRISQQWSVCDIEQYDHASGIGIVGWRHLSSESCGATPSTVSITVKNFFKPGAPLERYYETTSMRVADWKGLISQGSRPQHTYRPGGIALEDHPYSYTEDNAALVQFTQQQNVADQTPDDSNVVMPDVNNVNMYVESSDSSSIQLSYRAEVQQCYRTYLNREADEDGLAFWTNLVMEGKYTTAKVCEELKYSTEAKIRQCYLDTVWREPDAAGMEFWKGYVDRGQLTVTQVCRYIKDSAESVTKRQINDCYVWYLRRTADADGMNFWYSHVSAGNLTVAGVCSQIRAAAK